MHRVLILATAALVIAAVAASPALARPDAATVSNVTVTEGTPTEFHFALSTSSVKSGVIVFKITNKGKLPHDFRLCSKRSSSLGNSCNGRSSKQLSPGGSETFRTTVTVKGTYEYLCTLPGHAAGGMKGLLKVS